MHLLDKPRVRNAALAAGVLAAAEGLRHRPAMGTAKEPEEHYGFLGLPPRGGILSLGGFGGPDDGDGPEPTA